MGSVAAHSPPLVRAHSTSGRRALLFSAIALGAVVVIAFFLAVFERIAYAGEVMPGVRVQGVGEIDIAGKHESDAYAELGALAQRLERQPLRARVGGKEVVADPSILRVDVDQYATLQAARRAGRSGNPIEQTLGTVLRRFRPDEVPLRIHYDEKGLQGLLDGWSRPVAAGGVEGALRFQGTQVVEVYPQRGVGLQRDKAERLLLDEMRTTERKAVTLPVGAVNARVSRAEVDAAAAKARAVLSGNHVVRTPTTSVTITPEQLVAALGTRVDRHSLDLTIDQTKLRAALGAGLAPLETPAVDASFRITPANTVEVVPAVNGRAVDLGRVAHDILAGRQTIDAHIVVAAPPRTTAWARSLGIKGQVSTFTTHHNAGEDRVQNIHRAADILNNTVVEPGATFSLNETLGPRTSDRGFVVAPVFYQGEAEDVGGGVSQVATTLFNAVFFGGYEDVYHKPHSIYISRYPLGREATVNYPTVDLKFRDDTKAGILIRTAYTNTSITVTFYGDNEGRSVRAEDLKTLATYPVVPKYYDCPVSKSIDKNDACARLAAGEQKLIESGHTGMDVEYYRVISQPGHPDVRQRFFWRYQMYPDKYVVGKAAAPPSTTPGSTTAPANPPPTSASTPPTSAPSPKP